MLRLAVQPRGLDPVVRASLFAPTGNSAFDECFISAGGIPGTIEYLLTPRVQQRIMVHDDWVFRAEGYRLTCVRKGKFQAIEEIGHHVSEVMDVARAIPESVWFRYTGHPTGELATRISRLEDIDAATAFLQDLGRADRGDLAESNTPLAAFAHVRTPQQFMARFESLDPQRRMELFAMFMRADGDGDHPAGPLGRA